MVLLLKICDIQSLTMLHVCMMQLKFCDHSTNQPTNEQGDSRSWISRTKIFVIGTIATMMTKAMLVSFQKEGDSTEVMTY